MFGGSFSPTYRSESKEFPNQAALFREMLSRLVSSSRGWVHFESSDAKHFLEIADNGDSLLVNLSFPFAQPLDEVFEESGMSVPAAWQQTAFRRQGWWSSGYVTFTAPRDELESVVAFSEAVFNRLFQVAGDQPIKGWLDG